MLQDFLLKEFEHPIDYALESALPRLQAWGLVTINSQVGTVACCWRLYSLGCCSCRPGRCILTNELHCAD
jgi:hypothetical protein